MAINPFSSSLAKVNKSNNVGTSTSTINSGTTSSNFQTNSNPFSQTLAQVNAPKPKKSNITSPLIGPKKTDLNSLIPGLKPVTLTRSPYSLPEMVIDRPKEPQVKQFKLEGTTFEKLSQLGSYLKQNVPIAVENTKGNVKAAGTVLANKFVEAQEARFKHPIYQKEGGGGKEVDSLLKKVSDYASSNYESSKKNREKSNKMSQELLEKYGQTSGGTWLLEQVVRNSISSGIGLGLGASVGLVTKNPALGAAVGFAPSFAENTGSLYLDAKEFGVSDEKATDLALVGGFAIAYIDSLPIGELLTNNPQAKKYIAKKTMEYVLDSGKFYARQSLVEGSTESLQTVIENVTKKAYDENQSLFEGVPESAIVAGFMGGGSAVAVNAATTAIDTVTNKNSSVIEPSKLVEANKAVETAIKTPVAKRTELQKDIVDTLSTQTLTPVQARSLIINEGLQDTEVGKEIIKTSLIAESANKQVQIKGMVDTKDVEVSVVDPKTPESIAQSIAVPEKRYIGMSENPPKVRVTEDTRYKEFPVRKVLTNIEVSDKTAYKGIAPENIIHFNQGANPRVTMIVPSKDKVLIEIGAKRNRANNSNISNEERLSLMRSYDSVVNDISSRENMSKEQAQSLVEKTYNSYKDLAKENASKTNSVLLNTIPNKDLANNSPKKGETQKTTKVNNTDSRPDHQVKLEKLINEGKDVEAQTLIDSLDDEYKAPMQKLLDRVTGKKSTANQETVESTAEASKLEKAAINEFGLTKNPIEALYITSEGEFIDGTGKSQVAESQRRYMTDRIVDHREVASFVLDSSGTESLIEYMNKTGTVRMSSNGSELNVDVVIMPNEKQLNAIKEAFRDAEVIVADISSSTGSVLDSGEFDSFEEYTKFLSKHFKKMTRNLKEESFKSKVNQRAQKQVPKPSKSSKTKKTERAKTTDLPSSQTPVGTGKLEKSRFRERIQEQLLELDAGKYEWDENTGNYNKLNLKQDAENAVKFLETNPEEALRVALGYGTAPVGQTTNAIAVATALKARDEGNYALWTELVNKTALRGTRTGQEIVSLRGFFNNDTPENYVKQALDTKLKRLGKTLVSSVEKSARKQMTEKQVVFQAIDEKAAKLKQAIKRDQVKIKKAQDIIDALRC